MKQFINGKVIDIEVIETETFDPIPFDQRVINRIRAVYSIDDELAILRQRDRQPEEFAKYDAFVEQIKAEERGAI